MKSNTIKIYPTKRQKDILINWMNCYIKMYNETIALFKRYNVKINRAKKKDIYIKPLNLNFNRVRTDHLLNKKQKIINNSQLLKYKRNTKINCNVIDGAIKQACSNYKSALTNIKKKKYKTF